MTIQLNFHKKIIIRVIAAVAVLFGLMSIVSGGQVLFGDPIHAQAAGKYVPFVVWFNFFAGFFYIVAGISLWLQRRQAAWLSLLIAVSTCLIFALFAIHVFNGVLYENRTIIAMSLRAILWIVIFIIAYKLIGKKIDAD